MFTSLSEYILQSNISFILSSDSFKRKTKMVSASKDSSKTNVTFASL